MQHSKVHSRESPQLLQHSKVHCMENPQLFGKVASCLSAPDLMNFTAVCKSWAEAARLCGDGLCIALDFTTRKDAGPALYRFIECAPTYLSKVRQISFEFCKHLPEHAIPALSVFPNLTALNLNGCHRVTAAPRGLELVARACPAKLRRLELYWNPDIDTKKIEDLAQARFAPQLTRLNLSGTRLLTDKCVERLAQRCVLLEDLDLTRADRLTGKALSSVARHCPQLRRLTTYACSNLTDDGVQEIAMRCRRLEYVDFCGAKLLTDKSVGLMFSQCSQLVSVSLQWCIRLTDDSLRLANLPLLRHLSVHGVQKVTDDGFATLAEKSVFLESLDINGCVGVRCRSLDDLRKIFPRLKLLIPL
eukprot:gb/GEZN01008429.1/.p1 GENE.gb/GEZN01008429.1/~~gb/GEZN01008429.1/.p1  ORF type:complete len:361 (-),score=31.57 gb/GEZN01008429.1/:231-1313(-)